MDLRKWDIGSKVGWWDKGLVKVGLFHLNRDGLQVCELLVDIVIIIGEGIFLRPQEHRDHFF